MKKIIFTLGFVFTIVLSVSAQYILTLDGEVLGDTVTIMPEASTINELVFDAVFNNNSGSDVSIKVARTEIYTAEGTSNYFCWGACYPPSVDTSGAQMNIPSGGSSMVGDFSAHYTINETEDISLIEYNFFNVDDINDNVKVVVRFDTFTTDVKDITLNNCWLSHIYPNPASSFVNLDFDIQSDVEVVNFTIVNLLGKIVKDIELDTRDNKLNLDISDLDDGIYFYSILINGETYKTEKLIVK